MRIARGVVVLPLFLVVAACGGTSGKCGEGTVRHGSKCFPYDPDDRTPAVITADPPQRTREVGNVRLTTNEPATIYYTIDGSNPTLSSPNEPSNVLIPGLTEETEVRAFAVDLAGNQSDVQRFTWELDVTGPALLDFDLTLAGTQRTLTWMNPDPSFEPDFAGVIIARVDGRAAGPIDGQAYVVGDELAPGVEVVYAGTDLTFTESLATPPGMVRYIGWAHDDLFNYGSAGVDYELIAIPAQTATFTANAATGVVSVTAAPSVHKLSGSATYDSLNSRLTVSLTLENGATRVLFAPKLVVTTLSLGSFSNNDGSVTEGDYRSFGAALAPAATIVRTLVLDGIGATDVVSVTASIADNKVLSGGYWNSSRSATVLDLTAQNEITETDGISPTLSGPNQNDVSLRGGFISADGFLYMGHRQRGRVSVIDLTTGANVGGIEVRVPKSSVLSLTGDARGGALYALAPSAHAYSMNADDTVENIAQVDLVRLDPLGPRITGRLDLGSGRARVSKISPDGRTLAIANGYREIVFVDLVRFRVRTRLPMSEAIFGVEWSGDGSVLYAVSRAGRLFAIDVATADPGDPILLPGSGNGYVAVLGSSGRILVGRENTIDRWDPATQTATTITNDDAAFMTNVDGDVYYGGSCNSTVYHLDELGGTSDYSISTGDSICGHWIGSSPF